MIEPKRGDLVAIHLKADFYNPQEATGALRPILYELLEIDDRAAVLLETDESDIGKEINDHTRVRNKDRGARAPTIVLRGVFEIVPLSQEIIGACYRGRSIVRRSNI